MKQTPIEILDTMLGYLGFPTEVREQRSGDDLTLQIYSSERELLIGRRGQTLDAIQFLVNRVLQASDPEAHRVHVDAEHYRQMREDALVQRVKQIAEIVRNTGRPMHLDPMNAYDRRIVHNALKDDPDVASWSPPDDARLKRITLKRRR
jgi:spoIIIJ-associated protein